MFGSYDLSEVLKGLIEISNLIDLKDVKLDEVDDSLEVSLFADGKIKKFLVSVREL